MRILREPITAGLVVSSAMGLGMLLWVISGAAIEPKNNLSDQYLSLLDQRNHLQSQLSDLNNNEICKFSALPAQSISETLLPFEYDGTLDASVVWVITSNARGISTGSGFFISDSQIITNYHVVEDLNPGAKIYIAARGYGMTIGSLSDSGDSNFGAADLAVVTLDQPADWARPLNIRDASSNIDLRLSSVIAAGYPGAVIESYGTIDDMVTGNVADLPQLVLTSGVISSNANNQNDVQLISHTAQISQGNSGGPLVDTCGAVLGVNTYIYSDSDGIRSFALGPETLQTFLSNAAVDYSMNFEDCR